MKKFFTLIAAVLMTITASAKEDIDLSSVATDGTITFSDTWQWKGISYSSTDDKGNTVYADRSAYKYVLVVYSGGTCGDVNVIAQYNPDGTTGQYGANYYNTTVSASVNAAGGLIAVPLDAEHADSLNVIVFQNQNTVGTLVVKEAYFATSEEYQKTVDEYYGSEVSLFKGKKDLGTDWKWDSCVVVKSTPFVFAREGSRIKVEFTCNKDADYSQIGLIEDTSTSHDNLTCTKADENKWGLIDVFGKTSYTATLNSADMVSLQKYGLRIKGFNVTITSVVLTLPTSKNIVGISRASADVPIYNLAGQRVSKSYKGVVVQNGRKYLQR